MTLADSIAHMVSNALNSALITSAGDRARPINKVEYYEINAVEFEEIFSNQVAQIVIDKVGDLVEQDKEEIKRSILEAPEFSQMLGMMRGGPNGLLMQLLRVGGPLIVATLAPAMAEQVFKWLTRPGGWLDLRFRRYMENEANAFFDRMTQRNTQLGNRQVTIQSIAGFRNINGIGSENTLRQVREGGTNGNRLAMIDITDHARGLFD